MVLAAVLSMLRYVAGSDDRDFVDRLHSYFTCNLLIGLSVLVSFKQFGGKPVECLVPDIFSSSWEQYAENYCWASDTYYVPTNEPVAGLHIDEKRQRKISYYQWVPFFLLLEAACCQLPSSLWKYLAGHSGKFCNVLLQKRCVKINFQRNSNINVCFKNSYFCVKTFLWGQHKVSKNRSVLQSWN
ncbi:hypothetical protein CRE_10798 [Caenorhabditis remanei]|uniref:Innexin n=1 Tax=Caenorhabditis remanei TaxID=31234 RepID=E3NWM8_CAERE|nr:hypothetical protein CRE_10798 [Caenorhabditis remanei]